MVLSSDSTTTFDVNTTNGLFLIEEGANLIVNATNAIDGTSTSSGRQVDIDGHVATTGNGLALGASGSPASMDTVVIGASGSVIAAQTAVLAYESSFNLTNSGFIQGQMGGITLNGLYNVVSNHGTIESSDGNAIVSTGYSTILNSGAITSNGIALQMSGLGSSISNSGTIEGTVFGIYGSSEADYVNNIGGTIIGKIDLGAGDDQFVCRHGTIDGPVYGGIGNDTYYLDDNAIRIVENEDSGTDAVYASTSYSLGSNIENLVLIGSAALSGTGNGLANTLIGNDAANHLDGCKGADTVDYSDSFVGVTVNLSTGQGSGGSAEGDRLVNIENIAGSRFVDHLTGSAAVNFLDGGWGKDVLTGLGGKDIFDFVGLDGKDTVTDFTSGQDRIEIDETGISTLQDVQSHMSQHGGDVIIDFSAIHAGDELVLKHVKIADLQAPDFLFA